MFDNDRKTQPALDQTADEPDARDDDGSQRGSSRRPQSLGRRLLDAWILPFGVALFAITVFRAEIIASPPYWDSAMGLFVEANFLADTNFDYHRLATEEKAFVDGGPAVYIVSVMPTLLALVFRAVPSVTPMLVVLHLAMFACAAAIFVMMYSLLESRIGPTGAVWAGIATLTTPLYLVQIDMIGMELPMIACGMLALLLLAREHYVAAALATLAAFSVKLSGGLLTAALVCYLAMLVATGVRHADPKFLRRCWLGLGFGLIVLTTEVGVFAWLNNLPSRVFKPYEAGTFDLLIGLVMPAVLCPDVVLLLLASMVGLGVLLRRRVRSLAAEAATERSSDPGAKPLPASSRTTEKESTSIEPAPVESAASKATTAGDAQPDSGKSDQEKEESDQASATATTTGAEAAATTTPRSATDSAQSSDDSAPTPSVASLNLRELVEPLHEALRSDGVSAFGWLVVLATFAALVATYTIPRYVALTLPFLYVFGSLLLFRLVRSKRWATGVLIALVVLNIANRRGRFYPDIMASEHRTGAFLERSLEYLDDHRANIAAMRAVAEKCSDVPIVAANPFVHFLSLPRLGYVERPLHGYAINSFVPPTFKPVEAILEDCPPEVAVVSANNRFASPQTALSTVPVPEADDPRVFVDETRPDSPLIVFRKKWADDPPEKRRSQYLAMLWPARFLAEQAAALVQSGNLPAAEALYRRAVEIQPANAEARYQLGLFLSRVGKLDEARQQLEEAIRWAPGRADLFHQLGVVQTELERYDAAIESLKQSLARGPKRPAEVYCDLGVVYARLDQADEAIRQFSQALKLDARLARAHQLWGQVLLKQGATDAAIEQLKQANRLAPENVEVLFQLAAAYLKLDRSDDAELCLQEVLALAPQSDEAHYQLAAIYQSQGRLFDAVHQYRRALRLNPQRHDAANNIAWLIATHDEPSLGGGDEAVRLATYANQLTDHQEAAYLDTLAAALAEAGKFEEAVKTAKSAIAVAESRGDFDMAAEITKRLVQYEKSQPYRATDSPPEVPTKPS